MSIQNLLKAPSDGRFSYQAGSNRIGRAIFLVERILPSAAGFPPGLGGVLHHASKRRTYFRFRVMSASMELDGASVSRFAKPRKSIPSIVLMTAGKSILPSPK